MSGHFVDVWHGELSAHVLRREAFWLSLSEAERERAQSMKRPIACENYIVTRGLLRQTLAAYLDCQPAELQFAIGPHGKPYLVGQRIHFNLSHSGDHLLLAVSDMEAIGVDVEIVRDRAGLPGIAERSFNAAELAYWRALPAEQQVAAFFRLWTVKEAFVKAVGRGIALGLASCEVNVAGFDGFVDVPETFGPASAWSVREWQVAGQARAALVAPRCEYVYRRLAF